MELEYNEAKRLLTLEKRALDFADAAQVFAGFTATEPDDRFDYGENRSITTGLLHEEVVVLVWTERNQRCRIISMRRADKNERQEYQRQLDRSG